MYEKEKQSNAPFLEHIDFLSHRSFAKVPIFGTLHNPQNVSAFRVQSTT